MGPKKGAKRLQVVQILAYWPGSADPYVLGTFTPGRARRHQARLRRHARLYQRRGERASFQVRRPR